WRARRRRDGEARRDDEALTGRLHAILLNEHVVNVTVVFRHHEGGGGVAAGVGGQLPEDAAYVLGSNAVELAVSHVPAGGRAAPDEVVLLARRQAAGAGHDGGADYARNGLEVETPVLRQATGSGSREKHGYRCPQPRPPNAGNGRNCHRQCQGWPFGPP